MALYEGYDSDPIIEIVDPTDDSEEEYVFFAGRDRQVCPSALEKCEVDINRA